MAKFIPAKELTPGIRVIPGPGTRSYPVESVKRVRSGRFTLEVVIQGKGTWHFSDDDKVQVPDFCS